MTALTTRQPSMKPMPANMSKEQKIAKANTQIQTQERAKGPMTPAQKNVMSLRARKGTPSNNLFDMFRIK